MATKNENKNSNEKVVYKKRESITVAWFMNILAFGAVCIGGIGLFIAMILGYFGLTASWVNSLQAIANAIGWLALCLLSVRYITKRRKLSTWIIWIVAVVMIFSGTIIPLFR